MIVVQVGTILPSRFETLGLEPGLDSEAGACVGLRKPLNLGVL